MNILPSHTGTAENATMLHLRRFWKRYNDILGLEWLDRLCRRKPQLNWLYAALGIVGFLIWYWCVQWSGRPVPKRQPERPTSWIDFLWLIGMLAAIPLLMNYIEKRKAKP